MAALGAIISDINKLTIASRCQWCVFAFDLDHLTVWNTCLGHSKTDELIQQIGIIFQKYINEINNGKWIDKTLQKGYIYRTGSDEFVAVIKCGKWTAHCPLGSFYGQIKKEINALGNNIKNLLNINENDWITVKEKLMNAKDRNNNKIDMSLVGISTGLFIPTYDKNKEQNWMEKADKTLEHAKEMHLPNKNEIAIYWEYIGGLIDDSKVDKCLQESVWECGK
eukprot:549912_1